MRTIIKYTAILVVIITLAGCVSIDTGFMIAGNAASKSPAVNNSAVSEESKIMTIPGPANNSETRLEAGIYKGLTIDANSVVLNGRGPGKTIIAGDVIIKKNNCRIMNLTIRGDVIIEGNNADLTEARIEGNVESIGKNNSW